MEIYGVFEETFSYDTLGFCLRTNVRCRVSRYFGRFRCSGKNGLGKFRQRRELEELLARFCRLNRFNRFFEWVEYQGFIGAPGVLARAGGGDLPPFERRPIVVPAPGAFGTDDLNAQVYAKNRDLPLAGLVANERASFQAVLDLIDAAPEHDLVDRKRFAWTKAAPLPIGLKATRRALPGTSARTARPPGSCRAAWPTASAESCCAGMPLSRLSPAGRG